MQPHLGRSGPYNPLHRDTFISSCVCFLHLSPPSGVRPPHESPIATPTRRPWPGGSQIPRRARSTTGCISTRTPRPRRSCAGCRSPKPAAAASSRSRTGLRRPFTSAPSAPLAGSGHRRPPWCRKRRWCQPPPNQMGSTMFSAVAPKPSSLPMPAFFLWRAESKATQGLLRIGELA
ncbi:hypothetical protein SORBI_3007G170000 [Sorghum bicolor]|uniref:Uncharacterized protein n=1 Tax=Sorghum bicolor TaxID=4558 RepID=A0A1B6PI76_SORBI|nr:hypothetical protein SORBI_3007G170000 [Sorghum bicolor]